MKFFLTIFFLGLNIFHSIGQELPLKDGEIYYTIDIKNDSLSKDEIYSKCIEYLGTDLKKGSVYIQSEDRGSGQIMAMGITSFTKKDKSNFMWDIGKAARVRFKIEFIVSDNSVTCSIYDIAVVYHNGSEEVKSTLYDDATYEKMKIEGLKDGKYKEKRKKEYLQKVDYINDHFYTALLLLKRRINNSFS